MKIAIVNKFFFLKGGQETVALEQMKLLEQAGHEVAYFSMHHPKNPDGYQWSKYFVDHADFSLQGNGLGLGKKLAMGVRFIANTQAAEKFEAFLRDFRPDIIHCHGIAHQLTYTILPVAKRHGIPVVQTLHDYQIICPSYTLLKGDNSICTSGCSTSNYLPCVQNRCVKGSLAASVLSAVEMSVNRGAFDYTPYVEKFISPSRFLADTVINAGVSAKKLVQVSNFLVELDAITPNYQNDGYFLYVGRLSYEKGLKTLLEAFKNVPEAKLRIAGDGPLKSLVTDFCRENNVTNVELLGHLSREGIDQAVSNAISVIVPSEWYENQPMTIIEAFAHGKPVVGANIGGIPEMVIDGQNGFLFPPGDVQALAGLVRRMAGDEELLASLGKAARGYAVENYHAGQHFDSLMDIYTSLVP